ncbi:hypothetical protein FSP39_000668 [Pinctada imbricata]|uniref:G-protein coupled receptors family 2 profile 2 domain-containing protein n=1 Tax=Pinctada imbricata TaxID=66713 RepID=A0AA88Y893_PINIB|nr:hypothetical protein FSP39_000668 [Pinctada imbricata]
MREYYLTCGADYFCFDVSKTKVWDVAPMTSYRHLGVCPECSCDIQCIRRGDCCPDLFFTFPETECVNRTIIKGINDRARDQRYSEYMVTRCPEKTEPELRHRCESNTDIKSRLINFPVTGRETPLTFYNTYCAECHGVTDYDLWNLDIQCALFADFNYLSTIDDIIETAFDSVCTFQTYFPHIEIGLAPNCFEINEDETLITNVIKPGNGRISTKISCMDNIFCVLCNGVPMMAVAPGSGPSDLPEYDRAAGITWFPLLRNLFSIYQDSNGKRDSMEETKSQCPDEQFFDFSTNECRNITCFPGKYLEGRDCKSLLKITKNLRYSMRLMIGVKTYKPLGMGHLLPMVSSRITQFIDELLIEEDAMTSLHDIKGSTSCNTVIKKQTLSYFVANLELFFQMSLVRKDLEAKIVNIDWQLLNRSNVLYSIEILKNISRQLISFENSEEFCGIAANSRPFAVNTHRYYAAKVSEVLLCRQIELSRDEYNISDDKSHLTLTKFGKEVDNDHFALTPEGEARVCYEYLMNVDYFGHAEKQTQVVSDPYLKYLWIVSLICTIISLMCLILGILMYCLFSVLRTTPGKLILLFMVSLFLTLLFQVLSFFAVSSYEGCIIVGIVSHFTWLSVFTSMQACNFHMYQVFSSNKPRSNHSGHFFDKSIALFTAYIVFVPLIIVIANIGLTSAISQGRFLGFGGSKCFMDNTISVVLAFICPVLFICLSNIFFYCLTIRYIHRASNPTGKERNRNELSIFSRLATITGISWILQIIDSFLPLTAFSFIAAMVNSLQGLFVFVAFVMNARNIALLREKFARDENRLANKSMSTSSTATATFRTTSYQKTASTKV